jgi:disulfide bond formation protein DsbB
MITWLLQPTWRHSVWLAFLASCVMLGGAFVFQYAGGLAPCEMCIWQRIPHIIIIMISVIALQMLKSKHVIFARNLMLCLALLFITSAGLGLLHVGVEQKWWVIKSSCTATASADLSAIFTSQIIRCDTIAWSLFGISMAGYNMLLSLIMAIILVWCAWRYV